MSEPANQNPQWHFFYDAKYAVLSQQHEADLKRIAELEQHDLEVVRVQNDASKLARYLMAQAVDLREQLDCALIAARTSDDLRRDIVKDNQLILELTQQLAAAQKTIAGLHPTCADPRYRCQNTARLHDQEIVPTNALWSCEGDFDDSIPGRVKETDE